MRELGISKVSEDIIIMREIDKQLEFKGRKVQWLLVNRMTPDWASGQASCLHLCIPWRCAVTHQSAMHSTCMELKADGPAYVEWKDHFEIEFKIKNVQFKT